MTGLPDPLNLLVTDSGLGGLSVCAELAERLAAIRARLREKL